MPDESSQTSAAAEAAPEAAQQARVGGFRRGFAAFRDVHAAGREHNQATKQLQCMQAELESAEAKLKHRVTIASSYDEIIAKQEAERGAAEAQAAQLNDENAHLTREASELEAQLDQMRIAHEEQLGPYKKLMDSSRGRAEDATRSLTDAKREAKAAEGKVREATRKRDENITQANRKVDNALERLTSLEFELEGLSGEHSQGTRTAEEIMSEIESQRQSLVAARAEVSTASSDFQAAVEQAQREYGAQKQKLGSLERNAEAAKQEAAQRAKEYEGLKAQADAREQELSSQIEGKQSRIQQIAAELSQLRSRIDQAQALIDEANEIHATPELTQQLSAQVGEQKSGYAQQQRLVSQLAKSRQELRDETRRSRLLFVLGVVVIILAVVLSVWLILGSGLVG